MNQWFSKNTFIFLVGLAFFAPLVGAQNKCLFSMEHLFRKLHAVKGDGEGLYDPGNCCENIAELTHKMKEMISDFEIEKTNVVYVFHSGQQDVAVLRARFGAAGQNSTSYAFHVVLEYDGKIFDFDFKKEPEILDAESYFNEMFLNPAALDKPMTSRFFPSHPPAEELLVRTIPAKDYIRDFRSPSNPEGGLSYPYYLRDPNGKYPAQSIRSYLNAIKARK